MGLFKSYLELIWEQPSTSDQKFKEIEELKKLFEIFMTENDYIGDSKIELPALKFLAPRTRANFL